MQDKFSSIGPIEPPYGNPTPQGTKTSPELFNQITEYLKVSNQSQLLTESLAFLELLSQEQLAKSGMTKSFEEQLIPQGEIAQKILLNVNNAKELIPSLQNLSFYARNRDVQEGANTLLSIVGKTSAPNSSLMSHVQDDLQTALKPLLEIAGPIALELYLHQTTADSDSYQANLQQSLQLIASQNSLFSPTAQLMLEELEKHSKLPSIADLQERLKTAFANKEIRMNCEEALQKLTASISPSSILQASQNAIVKAYCDASAISGFEQMFKIGVTYLTSSALLLKKAGSTDPDLQILLTTLEGLTSPPTADELTTLSSLIPQLFSTYDQMGISSQDAQKFMNTSLLSLHQLCRVSIAEKQKAAAQVLSLTNKAAALTSFNDDLTTIQKILENVIDAVPLTASQLELFAKTLSNLVSQANLLGPIGTKLNALLTELASLKLTENSAFDKQKTQAALTTLASLQDASDARSDTLTTEVKGLRKTQQLFTAVNQKLQLAASSVQSKRAAKGMTMGAPQLSKTGAKLDLSQTTLQLLISIENLLSNLQNCGKNYSFTTWISQYITSTAGGTTTYNIPPKAVLSALAKELQNAGADSASLSQASGKIATLISQLNAQQKINPTTAVQQLIQQLTTQQANITAQIAQLKSLQTQLQACLSAISGESGPTTTIPTGLVPNIGTIEGAIINGNTTANPPYAGIGSIFTFFVTTEWDSITAALEALTSLTAGFSMSNLDIAKYFSLLPPDGSGNDSYNLTPTAALSLIEAEYATVQQDQAIATAALQKVQGLIADLQKVQPQSSAIKNLIFGLSEQQKSLQAQLTQMNGFNSIYATAKTNLEYDIAHNYSHASFSSGVFTQLSAYAFNIRNGNPQAGYEGLQAIATYFYNLTWQDINIAEEFVKAIDSYMDSQNAIVSGMNAQLSFLNQVGSALNNIEFTCENFQFAANNYSIASYFPVQSTLSGNTIYNITETAAASKIKAEETTTNNDLASANTAISQINAELTKLQADPQTTQVTHLESQLKTQLATLNAQKTNLTTLQGKLTTLLTAVQACPTTGTTITIASSLLPDVSNAESPIVKGNAAGSPPPAYGSLSSIQNTFQTLKGSFATLSQRQQMMLQMTLTEVQQEWTMVTSSLQTLMEMYKTITGSLATR